MSKKEREQGKFHFETSAIRIQADRSTHREHSVPIFATSSFVFDSAEHGVELFSGGAEGNIYTRYSNPSNNEFIDKLCALEGAESGIATASGMAAMFLSIASFVKSGDHVLASRSLFGSTHQILTQLLPRWGISHTYADIGSPEKWEGLIQNNTRLVFVESPSNPGLDLVDLAWLSEICRRNGLMLVVDNCFATPYLQRPIEFGADLVTHSATKLIDGQGRVLGGAVVGRKDLIDEVMFLSRHTGPAMSPFNGWILSKSLETLAVRVERHCENALRLASWLEQHDQVAWVKYPFLKSHPQNELAVRQMRHGGSILTFALKGGIEQTKKFLNSLNVLSLTSNLGDTRSIATHPASTTHSKLSPSEREAVGITDDLIRISVGLEHAEDIRNDLEQAIAHAVT